MSCLVKKLNSIFNLRFCKNQLHYTHYAKYFSNKTKFNSMTGKTNFICQLPWTIDYTDILVKKCLLCPWQCFWWECLKLVPSHLCRPQLINLWHSTLLITTYIFWVSVFCKQDLLCEPGWLGTWDFWSQQSSDGLGVHTSLSNIYLSTIMSLTSDFTSLLKSLPKCRFFFFFKSLLLGEEGCQPAPK